MSNAEYAAVSMPFFEMVADKGGPFVFVFAILIGALVILWKVIGSQTVTAMVEISANNATAAVANEKTAEILKDSIGQLADIHTKGAALVEFIQRERNTSE